MTWRDNLRSGSFKGIPFKVQDSDREGSRRLVINKYPFRDIPFTEDLGRNEKKWSISGYIVGPDYMQDRDALIDAVENGGTGSLIHPYYGTVNAIAGEWRFKESQTEGGYVSFSIGFVEPGENIFPDGAPLPSALVSLEADALIDVVRTDFINNIQVDAVAEWVRDSYSGGLTQASDIFNDIQNLGGINSQGTTALINQAADWVANVADLKIPSLSLIGDIQATADKLITTFKGLRDLAPSANDSGANLDQFSTYAIDRSPSITAQATVSNSNSAVTETFIKTVALANEAKAATEQEFTSYTEAITARKVLLDKIDVLAGETTNDTVYEQFRAVRQTVAIAIPADEVSLPRITIIKTKQDTPSLVLAYDVYGDVSKEADIIARNNVRNPCFIPGGEVTVLEYE